MSRVPSRIEVKPPKSGKRTHAEGVAIARWRLEFREEIGRCEACGCNPYNRRGKPEHLCVLTVHEIARGSGVRAKSLTYRGGVLCLCWGCNSGPFTDVGKWPIPKQLCLLRARRPDDYDLKAFVKLIKPDAPNWVTRREVMVWLPEIERLVSEVDALANWNPWSL